MSKPPHARRLPTWKRSRPRHRPPTPRAPRDPVASLAGLRPEDVRRALSPSEPIPSPWEPSVSALSHEFLSDLLESGLTPADILDLEERALYRAFPRRPQEREWRLHELRAFQGRTPKPSPARTRSRKRAPAVRIAKRSSDRVGGRTRGPARHASPAAPAARAAPPDDDPPAHPRQRRGARERPARFPARYPEVRP